MGTSATATQSRKAYLVAAFHHSSQTTTQPLRYRCINQLQLAMDVADHANHASSIDLIEKLESLIICQYKINRL